MAPGSAVPARKPVPTANGLQPGWEKDLTKKFRELLSTKRMNALRRIQPEDSSLDNSQQQLPLRHGSGPHPARSATPLDDFPLGAPQQIATTSLSNIPIMATPPSRQSHHRFRNELHMLSETPCKWENPGLLDEAMRALPLERLYRLAQEEADYYKAAAASLPIRQGDKPKRPAWELQDCLIRQLMKWFKREFFTYVNVPRCSRCNGNTMPLTHPDGRGVVLVAPTAEEHALSATKVELYTCPRPECGAQTRFARYTDAFVLLNMKRGRVGEWVNTFGMLCRALGSRTRWMWVLWDNHDYSWVEVYSEYRKRWIHVDPCEDKWDSPTMYAEGWGRKIRYCLAFSADGVTDVTRRYCRDPTKYAAERSRCPEDVLLHILDEIRRLRRRNMDKDTKFRLEGEDSLESRELRHYYVTALMAEVMKLSPPTPKTGEQRRLDDADRRKAEERRQEAIQNREHNRQEEGRTSPQRRPDMPPPPPPR